MTDDNRGFEVGQDWVVRGHPSMPDGVYVVVSTTDSGHDMVMHPSHLGLRVIDDV